MHDKILQFYKDTIEQNETILLSSFGKDSVMKSRVKTELIQEVINAVGGEHISRILDDFYSLLKKKYIQDEFFLKFDRYSIDKFVRDEKFTMERLWYRNRRVLFEREGKREK
ncbi:hypothetical protein [Liquorilactobacillus hordei]|uniref:hypothetical protein n=1 Tax=Liquorilactobacillus hordei TaxID=468911 RepID=UPI0039EB3F1C